MSNKTEVLQHCSNWYQSLTGQSALSKTEQLCAKNISEVFGYYAIQIGMLSGECNLLEHSRVNAGFSLANPDNLISLDKENSKAIDHAVIASNEQLPISTDNVDLVV